MVAVVPVSKVIGTPPETNCRAIARIEPWHKPARPRPGSIEGADDGRRPCSVLLSQRILIGGLQPRRKGPDFLLAGVTGSADHIEAIALQAQVESLHERAGGELVRHEHIAEDPDSLSSDYGLDGVQLLPETQVLHVPEFGH